VVWIVVFVVGGDEAQAPTADSEFDDDRGPPQPEEWSITVDEPTVGVHAVHLIKTFEPLEEDDVEDVGGRLVWPQTEVELCRVGIRSVGPGFVQIGDIFFTTETCDDDTSMGEAVEEFGPPQSACVFVRVDGVEDEYCAPLERD
jgi:hypothetical protein